MRVSVHFLRKHSPNPEKKVGKQTKDLQLKWILSVCCRNLSESVKHQSAEAGVEVLMALVWPADAAKYVAKLVYRPLEHCRQTMLHFVLTL